VPAGHIYRAAVGDQVYAAVQRFVPSGREPLLVFLYVVATLVIVLSAPWSAPAFVAYCAWGYVVCSSAAEWNSSRYFFPCIGLCYLQLCWGISRSVRWTRRGTKRLFPRVAPPRLVPKRKRNHLMPGEANDPGDDVPGKT